MPFLEGTDLLARYPSLYLHNFNIDVFIDRGNVLYMNTLVLSLSSRPFECGWGFITPNLRMFTTLPSSIYVNWTKDLST